MRKGIVIELLNTLSSESTESKLFLVLGALGPFAVHGLFSSCGEGYTLVVVRRLHSTVASLVKHRL